ncbi:Asp-tRNA(Asn)/Glu-tRNA(Gln) amidotransferase subunit GatB [Candidatus Saccharibacteria bacterium]|nr:Asp-tRNA(Asn)/Glu-tRNA(Gln) amidotransferase subunit GatB [Candidatus Saccharibacteria bacterium]
MTEWEMTIGIECHVQLATATKLFSPADNDARDKASNSVVHPIDYGLPGMLPILNHEAVVLAIKAGKALNAGIARISRFDRKHYFYPDLPMGYQITQMYQPTILEGWVDAPLENGSTVRVRVHHAHIESDAGKLTHYGDHSLVDLNRAGTPLIEIVSEPDMHSPQEAKAYASELHKLMVFAGVTHGDLYHGNMRFDVNISVAPKGSKELGTRAEVKNLNSFRSVEKAAEYEYARQVALLEKGERVVQETRGWDDAKQKTSSQRSKEDAQDYRYMPDADIPPIVLSDDEIDTVQATVPKLPPEYREEWKNLGVDKSVINSILNNRPYAELLSAVLADGGEASARRVANWIASNLTIDEMSDTKKIATVADLLVLCDMANNAEITSNAASELFNELMNGSADPRAIAKARNLLQVSDEGTIAAIVDEVLADPASQKAVQDIRSGNEKAIGFLVGQIMKKSAGKANPGMAQKMIRERL